MQMEHKAFALEVKEVTAEGVVEGYASTFGNIDNGGDKVEPGAFVAGIRKAAQAGRTIPMLFNHSPSDPIGVWEDMAEDKKGLWVKGQMIMDVARAREVHSLMKAKALGGLSIGYRTDQSDWDGQVRILKSVDLFEVSVVTFPMNERAKISSVKSQDGVAEIVDRLAAGDRLTVREFEILAKGLGLSNSQAERAARINLKGQGEPAKAAQTDGVDFLRCLAGK